MPFARYLAYDLSERVDQRGVAPVKPAEGDAQRLDVDDRDPGEVGAAIELDHRGRADARRHAGLITLASARSDAATGSAGDVLLTGYHGAFRGRAR